VGGTTEVLIPLRGGPAVPENVVSWLLGAEDRGLRFRLLPDGRLWVGPENAILADDDRFLRRHRDWVAACVRYIDDLPPC
jgi:hypothetical protein